MGEIMVKVRLINEFDEALWEQGRLPKKRIRSVEVNALVDTGAVMMLLPRDLVKRLGLRKIDTVIVGLADDRRIEMDKAGTLSLTIAGRTMKCDCLVGPPGCEPLIGQLVIEELDLIADPAKRTLTPRPESPFSATLKLKALASKPLGLAGPVSRV
ncbi:MAG: aspartyl protease family protein [Elusimicrobia bacterium]|nr:aspartyl protease family protein [Elusimicrobiota bacterium]